MLLSIKFENNHLNIRQLIRNLIIFIKELGSLRLLKTGRAVSQLMLVP